MAGLPTFTASVGVVDVKTHEHLPDAVARADTALYQAKQYGRDQVVVHDGAGEVLSEAEIHSDLAGGSRSLATVSDVRRQLR